MQNTVSCWFEVFFNYKCSCCFGYTWSNLKVDLSLFLQSRGLDLSRVRTCVVVAEERPRIALTQSFSKLFKDLGLHPRAVSTSFGCRVNLAICLQVSCAWLRTWPLKARQTLICCWPEYTRQRFCRNPNPSVVLASRLQPGLVFGVYREDFTVTLVLCSEWE